MLRRRPRVVRLTDEGILIYRRRDGHTLIRYGEILTVERARAARRLNVHLRGCGSPVELSCRGLDRHVVESELRFVGVRTVDCWGAILAPTLLEFEDELAREPIRLRQSSDDA